jgi:hypothetical protein
MVERQGSNVRDARNLWVSPGEAAQAYGVNTAIRMSQQTWNYDMTRPGTDTDFFGGVAGLVVPVLLGTGIGVAATDIAAALTPAVVGTGTTATTAACADGDCTNEVEAGANLVQRGVNWIQNLLTGCSFSADTLVAVEAGEQPISTLKIGDQVLAYNQLLRAIGPYTITAVLIHTDPIIEYVTIDGEQVETTPEHPFYTLEHGWLPAGELWVGAHVRKADGGYGLVQAIKLANRTQPMYNLTVEGAHTFFVGTQRWLVHNSCINIDLGQLQAKFKHAVDFGITGNWNTANATKFLQAIQDHVHGPNIQAITGTYRGVQSVIHYFDATTGLDVMTDLSGNFISGWRLSADQIKYLLTNGNVQ